MVNFVVLFFIVILLALFVTWILSKLNDTIPKTPSSFGVMSQTTRGDVVRSKAEKQVADYLHEKEIDYIYEQTIILGWKKHKIKYDFLLPESKIYIEYWGLEGASGDIGKRYIDRKKEKIKLYDKFNLKLVSLYPEDLNNLEECLPQKIKDAENRHKSIWKKIKRFILNSLFCFEPTYEDEMDEALNIWDDLGKLVFCINCGEEMDGGSKFCFHCGATI